MLIVLSGKVNVSLLQVLSNQYLFNFRRKNIAVSYSLSTQSFMVKTTFKSDLSLFAIFYIIVYCDSNTRVDLSDICNNIFSYQKLQGPATIIPSQLYLLVPYQHDTSNDPPDTLVLCEHNSNPLTFIILRMRQNKPLFHQCLNYS